MFRVSIENLFSERYNTDPIVSSHDVVKIRHDVLVASHHGVMISNSTGRVQCSYHGRDCYAARNSYADLGRASAVASAVPRAVKPLISGSRSGI